MNIVRTIGVVIACATFICSGGLFLAAAVACYRLWREERRLPTNRTSADLWDEFDRVDPRAFHPSTWH